MNEKPAELCVPPEAAETSSTEKPGFDPAGSDTLTGRETACVKCSDTGKGYIVRGDGQIEEITDQALLKRMAWMPPEPK